MKLNCKTSLDARKDATDKQNKTLKKKETIHRLTSTVFRYRGKQNKKMNKIEPILNVQRNYEKKTVKWCY